MSTTGDVSVAGLGGKTTGSQLLAGKGTPLASGTLAIGTNWIIPLGGDLIGACGGSETAGASGGDNLEVGNSIVRGFGLDAACGGLRLVNCNGETP